MKTHHTKILPHIIKLPLQSPTIRHTKIYTHALVHKIPPFKPAKCPLLLFFMHVLHHQAQTFVTTDIKIFTISEIITSWQPNSTKTNEWGNYKQPNEIDYCLLLRPCAPVRRTLTMLPENLQPKILKLVKISLFDLPTPNILDVIDN